MSQIPISIITGFLGSGKTTLLSKLLHSDDMQNTALIINEFGEIGIDNLLVKSSVENTLLLENGCVCCSIRGDLSDTISGLFAQSDNGDIPRFDYIIIETTGLAQPGPIVQTIKSDISLNTELGSKTIYSLGKNANKKFNDKFLREQIVVSAHTRNMGL